MISSIKNNVRRYVSLVNSFIVLEYVISVVHEANQDDWKFPKKLLNNFTYPIFYKIDFGISLSEVMHNRHMGTLVLWNTR